MAFHSFTCAKTNLPILAGPSWGIDFPEASRVVIIFQDGRQAVHGQYDGYGKVNGFKVGELIERGEAKLVLRKWWEGETFQQLGSNHVDPGQGILHSEGFVHALFQNGPIASYEAYLEIYKKEHYPEHAKAAGPSF